jgi:hypothetical protein
MTAALVGGMQDKLYRLIVSTLDAYRHCCDNENHEWSARHWSTLKTLESLLPSGSGIDSGTTIDTEKSTSEKLVLNTAYHHMNDAGYYDGWTEHTVTVRASLLFELNITISGRNRNDIKDYLHEVFLDTLKRNCALAGELNAKAQ